MRSATATLAPPLLALLAARTCWRACCSSPSRCSGCGLSRNYPIGTALRMGTGYVPRLLCWILLGARRRRPGAGAARGAARAPLRSAAPRAGAPVVFVTASLVVFGLSIERLGLVVVDPAADRRRRACDARAAAARDRGRRAGADRAVLGHLHLRARPHHPGLAGVVAMELLRQPRARLRRRADAGQSRASRSSARWSAR